MLKDGELTKKQLASVAGADKTNKDIGLDYEKKEEWIISNGRDLTDSQLTGVVGGREVTEDPEDLKYKSEKEWVMSSANPLDPQSNEG